MRYKCRVGILKFPQFISSIDNDAAFHLVRMSPGTIPNGFVWKKKTSQ